MKLFLSLFTIILWTSVWISVTANLTLKQDRDYIRLAKDVQRETSPRLLRFLDSDRPTCHNLWKVTKTFSFESTRVKFYVNVCRNELVISFPGTLTAEDVIVDSDVLKTTCTFTNDCGKIHSGFLLYYLGLRDAIMSELQVVNKRYGRYSSVESIVFTGHSLGGAIATIAAFETQILINKGDLAFPPMQLVTFGSPRVGNAKFATSVTTVGFKDIRRYVHRITTPKKSKYDFVTQLPPRFLSFRHVLGLRVLPCPVTDLLDCHYLNTYLIHFDPDFQRSIDYLEV